MKLPKSTVALIHQTVDAEQMPGAVRDVGKSKLNPIIFRTDEQKTG